MRGIVRLHTFDSSPLIVGEAENLLDVGILRESLPLLEADDFAANHLFYDTDLVFGCALPLCLAVITG